MAKKLLIALLSAMAIYGWWSYLLLGLRGGPDRGRDIDAAIAERVELEAIDAEFEDLSRDAERAEQRISEFERTLVWVGDPVHPDEMERDARAMCPLIKASFEGAVRFITSYRCEVSKGVPLVAGGRVLPLTITMGAAEPGDGERLVLAAEEHATMRLLSMSVSYASDADVPPEAAYDADTRVLLYDREIARLSIDFYMKQEPETNKLQEALDKYDQRIEEADIGLQRQQLIGRARSALEEALEKARQQREAEEG